MVSKEQILEMIRNGDISLGDTLEAVNEAKKEQLERMDEVRGSFADGLLNAARGTCPESKHKSALAWLVEESGQKSMTVSTAEGGYKMYAIVHFSKAENGSE